MGSYFVEVEITSDSQSLADGAVERLQGQWIGWEPNDADLEVVQIEALAPMAQNAAETAARVPGTVFRAYGTKLIGRPYDDGQAASTTVRISLLNTNGYTIPVGSEIVIDGFAFDTIEDVIVPAGTAVAAGVIVQATEPGVDKNGLAGDVVSMISALAFVTGVTVEAPTAGGTDPEDDEAYQSNLSQDLLLQAKTLVTERDFELWALSYADVGRVVATHTGNRAITYAMTTLEGEVVPLATKNAIAADFAAYRLVNTVLTFTDPTYTTIDINYTVKALPGFDYADLIARVNAMLRELLSPASYGAPKSGGPGGVTSGWINDPIVRTNLIIDRIGDVEGVAYVVSVAIAGNAGASNAAGWTMAGTYALPRPGVMTGVAT